MANRLPTSGIATFSWSKGSASEFMLKVGAMEPGSIDVYDGRPTYANSTTVSGIPATGAALFVRLNYKLSGVWQYRDDVYLQGGTLQLPAIVSPASGTQAGNGSVTFTWNKGSAVSFQLKVGTQGPYSNDVYVTNREGGQVQSNSITVPNVPHGTGTLYVRFYYRMSNQWGAYNYTYAMTP